MPRRPKPFFHRGWWCTNVGGSRTKLAKGRDGRAAAEDALLDLLQELRSSANGRTYPQLTVADLCEQFLDWVEVHRSKATYEDYRRWLKKWRDLHGNRRAREVRKLDLEQWKISLAEDYPSSSSINHHIKAVKACWGWATENELLPINSLAKVKVLYSEGRERIFKPEEFRTLLRNTDALFRQVPIFCRLTGVRPGQFCQLTWSQVNFEAHVIVIRHHKTRRTSKKQKPLLIQLVPIVENLLRWRLKKYGQTEKVFLNSRRKPWTVNALRCRMRSLRVVTGIGPDENGERIVMYTTRHSFGTGACAKGVADRRLADLMGHTDTKTTQKYIHLANPDLQDAARQATENYLGISRSVETSS